MNIRNDRLELATTHTLVRSTNVHYSHYKDPLILNSYNNKYEGQGKITAAIRE